MKYKIRGVFLLLFIVVIFPLISVVILQFDTSSFFLSTLLLCTKLFSLCVFSQLFYSFFLTLFGYKKPKRDYEIIANQTKFLLLIPAHNEAEVLESTLNSLANIDYQSDLFKVLVISDNSDDDTVAVVKKHGFAEVIETDATRYQNIGVGKPRALQYAFLSLLEKNVLANYDVIFVLDADNHVDEHLLKELNSQYLQKDKPEAIQTYLDSKNMQKTLSLGYAISYWTMNRFYQLAKYRLHLPNAIGGTGFCVKIDWLLQNDGFQSTSLTEDLEMEIRIVEGNGRILWNHFARIYDEKPTELKASMIQRYRWSKGHWFVAFSYSRRMLQCFFKNPSFKYIDQIIYLFSMNLNFQVLTMFSFLLTWIFQLLLSFETMNDLMLHWSVSYIVLKSILNYAVLIYGFVPVYCGVMMDTDYFKVPLGQKIWRFFRIGISFVYFSITYGFCQIWALMTYKDQGNWSKTTHCIERNDGKKPVIKNRYEL